MKYNLSDHMKIYSFSLITITNNLSFKDQISKTIVPLVVLLYYYQKNCYNLSLIYHKSNHIPSNLSSTNIFLLFHTHKNGILMARDIYLNYLHLQPFHMLLKGWVEPPPVAPSLRVQNHQPTVNHKVLGPDNPGHQEPHPQPIHQGQG